MLKPAETTPLTALLLAEIMQEAELPPGVVNIVTGAGATGAALVDHPDVDKIAFTGSTDVGKRIQRAIAGTGKKLTLELGGKAANIVFDDARARSGGRGHHQRHLLQPGPRLLRRLAPARAGVGRTTSSSRKLKDRMETLRVGDPLDKNTDIGAINSQVQLEKIQELVRAGVEEGARDLPAAVPRCPSAATGSADLLHRRRRSRYRIAQEEIFGPVLIVLTFRTPDEAVEKANNTPYGLSAGVWTEKGSRIFKMASSCAPASSGRTPTTSSTRPRPFGGYKERASVAKAACTGSRRTSRARRGRRSSAGSRGREQDARPALRPGSGRASTSPTR